MISGIQYNKLNPSSKEIKLRKKRKKSDYKKISNQTRKTLLELVYLKEYNLKDASSLLNINYSTAKTILRIFRLEKRIEKKNAEEEKNLKEIFLNYNKDKKDEFSNFNDKDSLFANNLTPKNEINFQIYGNYKPYSDNNAPFKIENNLFIFKVIRNIFLILNQIKGSLQIIKENENEIQTILYVLMQIKLSLHDMVYL